MWYHKTPLFGKVSFQIISWQLSILTSLGLRGAPGYSLDQAHHLPIEMDPLIGMLIYLLLSVSVVKLMTKNNLGKSLFWLVVPEGESLMTGKHCSRKLRDHILDQTKRVNRRYGEAVTSQSQSPVMCVLQQGSLGSHSLHKKRHQMGAKCSNA